MPPPVASRPGRRLTGLIVAPVLLLTACTGTSDSPGSGAPSTPAPTASATTSSPPSSSPPPSTPTPTTPAPELIAPTQTSGPARFDAAAAMADVRLLAGRIGPRLATDPAYERAAGVVARRFEQLGYAVQRQRFDVPAGDSWGVPVDAGRSSNVIATPGGLEPDEPYVLVGAHLDTVAVAPGAEDNGSGVAVLLELARLASTRDPGIPAVLVAFGAEEPRGPGDDLHHFGSQTFVRRMMPAERAALVGMVSLDRVGVGTVVPVCTGGLATREMQRQLLRTARRAGVPTLRCENSSSDHWSFEKAGFAAVRLGSTSYAAYHSADDLPGVVDQRQLARTGRLAWRWLRQPR